MISDSTIGKPAPFDRAQLDQYRDALRKLILNSNPSSQKDALKQEFYRIDFRISYYDENKIAYGL